MRNILYLICFFLIWAAAIPVYGNNSPKVSPPSEISAEDMKVVKVMEVLNMMDLMENLALLEDIDLLDEEESNENKD